MHNDTPIYSPYSPAMYSRAGYGHGLWVKDDLPKWNLLWATFPELDLYLDEAVPLPVALHAIDAPTWGVVAASAHPEVFPRLRQALCRPPADFLKFLHSESLAGCPAYDRLGQEWVAVMTKRLGGLSPYRIAKDLSAHYEARAVGNVLHVETVRWNRS